LLTQSDELFRFVLVRTLVVGTNFPAHIFTLSSALPWERAEMATEVEKQKQFAPSFVSSKRIYLS
jgi:hypothetical protein